MFICEQCCFSHNDYARFLNHSCYRQYHIDALIAFLALEGDKYVEAVQLIKQWPTGDKLKIMEEIHTLLFGGK